MKYLLLLFLALSAPVWGLLTRVRDRNVAVAAGTTAYARGDATRAATAFAAALGTQTRRAPDPRLLLNLAHAQVQASQQAAAHATYGRLLTGSPAAMGSIARQQLAVLAARQGEIAQALSLLHQALLLDPNNSGARFNFEVLSAYLAQRPSGPKITPPPKAPEAGAPKPSPKKKAADKSQPVEKAGTTRKGEIPDAKPAPAAPNTPPQRRPDAAGQPDNQRPNNMPGTAATGGRTPGQGAPLPIASGEQRGSQRGLDRSSAAPAPTLNNQGNHPGADDATPADLRLQTQRERLQAMNLSPAQARQLLETMRAQEQQYLQQVTRPTRQKPDPNKSNW